MRVRYPAYYESFSCIADKCEDTCCAGWEIDIDEASYAYYQSLPGRFGEKVRGYLKEYDGDSGDAYEAHGFILQDGKKCPFLQEDGLCEMILTLGENAICDVCTYTPRNYLEYGGMREISVSPGCAEAGRLLFGSAEKISFVTGEEAGELDIEESADERHFGETIRAVRDFGLEILQERDASVLARMRGFLFFGNEVQRRLNSEDVEGLLKLCDRRPSDVIARAQNVRNGQALSEDEGYLYFEKRFELFGGLDSLGGEWQRYLEDMRAAFVESDNAEKNYLEAVAGYRRCLESEHREYESEHLAVYLAFLMIARCVDDWNFWGKVQFVTVSWLFVRDMNALRFYETGNFTVEDRVDVMRIYAKEVEHSQENLDEMQEEFLFEEFYSYEQLMCQLEGC